MNNKIKIIRETARYIMKNNKKKIIAILIPLAVFGISVGIKLTLNFENFSMIPVSVYEIKQKNPEIVYYKGSSFKEVSDISLNAQAAILVESSTGTVLYAKNEHQRRDPASITKIMTAMVALERGDLSDVVTVSENSVKTGGSSIGLKAGEQHNLEELIRSTMVKSGNDGAVAIAEHIGQGNVENFVELMNLRADSIGLENTNFVNPHGLTHDNHFSTAYDLAMMCMMGLKDKKFSDIVSTKEQWYSMIENGETDWFQNTNKLLWSFEGADGVKTGTTNRAGNCLAASATRNGLQFIAVVLNSSSRWNDCASLLEYGFSEFTKADIIKSQIPIQTVGVKVSNEEAVKIGVISGSDFSVIVRKDDIEKIEVEILADEDLRAPVNLTDKIGELNVYVDNEKISSIVLYPDSSVKKQGVIYRLKNAFKGK